MLSQSQWRVVTYGLRKLEPAMQELSHEQQGMILDHLRKFATGADLCADVPCAAVRACFRLIERQLVVYRARVAPPQIQDDPQEESAPEAQEEVTPIAQGEQDTAPVAQDTTPVVITPKTPKEVKKIDITTLAPDEFPCVKGEIWKITPDLVQHFQQTYLAVDVVQEIRKARSWCITHDKERKTSRGMDKFLNAWLARCQDRGGSSGNRFACQTSDPPVTSYWQKTMKDNEDMAAWVLQQERERQQREQENVIDVQAHAV